MAACRTPKPPAFAFAQRVVAKGRPEDLRADRQRQLRPQPAAGDESPERRPTRALHRPPNFPRPLLERGEAVEVRRILRAS